MKNIAELHGIKRRSIMPYIILSIKASGECGYLSIDDRASKPAANGYIYKVTAGIHNIAIHSASDADRKSAKASYKLSQIAASNNPFEGQFTSKAYDKINERDIKKAVKQGGVSCRFGEVELKENDVIELALDGPLEELTSDNAPVCNLLDVDDEELKEYEANAREIKDAYTPVRNVPMMVIGVLLVFGAVSAIASGITGSAASVKDSLIAGGVCGVVGAALIYLGSIKKIRLKKNEKNR